MKVLAIIPARGGSKGIRKKNIRNLAGKPLIAYAILSAKKSKFIDKIIVSTDNKEISRISISYGADVPFLRPKHLAQDTSSTLDVVKHALRFLEDNQSYAPDMIVVLQPTSPLRTTKIIDSSISLLKNSNATSVITVSKIKKHPYSSFWLKKGMLKPFKSNFTTYNQRQKYTDLYYPTGDVYVFWNKTLKKYDSIYGHRIKALIIADENTTDIDTPFDLFVSEMLMLHWNKFKKI